MAYIKSRICAACIFIVDCLSSFYSAIFFEGPRCQKCFKFRVCGKSRYILVGGGSHIAGGEVC